MTARLADRGYASLFITPVSHLYLELFQEKALNRYSFFRPRVIPTGQ